jgi:thiol-disulfide isomerase/thioredoxin
VYLGLPALLLTVLGLLRLWRGEARLPLSLLPLAVAVLQLVAAALALRGRTGPAGLFLVLALAGGLAGLVASWIAPASPWTGAATGVPGMLVAAAGLLWLLLRRATARGAPARNVVAATLLLLVAFAAGIPDLARRAELGVELLAAGPARTSRLEPGARMPPAAFVGLDGAPVRLDEPGVVYVVNFWATWCGPCLLELPALLETTRALGDAPVRVVAVNTEDLPVEDLREFLRRRDLAGLSVVLDPRDVRDRAGIEYLPLTLVVRDGTVLERHEGYAPDALTASRLAALAEAGNRER